MKFKHFETESGKTIKTAQFDGYLVGDGLLEGLMFQVDIQDDGTMRVYVKDKDQKWFEQYNTTKWLKEAKEYAEKNNDIFEDPISGEDCWTITDEAKPIVQNTGHMIKTSTIDEILNSKESETSENEADEVKEPVIGRFKPKRKFLSFIKGLKGRIRLLSNTAFIKGEKLSGMLEGVTFKVTICDEGTVNFEEVDTNQCDSKMIQRLIDELDSSDVTGYTQKFILPFEFYDNKNNLCYLEVEHKKPIDMLFSLFDNEETSKEVSETGMSILDALFSSETDEIQREFEGENIDIEEVIETPIKENEAQRMMRESFERMNAEKVQELKDRIENTQSTIQKCKVEIRNSESKMNSQIDDLKVLNTRLETLMPKDVPIGYDFFVSEEKKTGIEPDETLVSVVEKISPILKLNAPVVIDMLTKGFFEIKIKKQDGGDIDRFIINKILNIDPTGTVSVISNNYFSYTGELTWHQLVNKMIRMGFEQNPDFDKECGSNSYESDNELIQLSKD